MPVKRLTKAELISDANTAIWEKDVAVCTLTKLRTNVDRRLDTLEAAFEKLIETQALEPDNFYVQVIRERIELIREGR